MPAVPTQDRMESIWSAGVGDLHAVMKATAMRRDRMVRI
jgi:hypothetical protein